MAAYYLQERFAICVCTIDVAAFFDEKIHEGAEIIFFHAPVGALQRGKVRVSFTNLYNVQKPFYTLVVKGFTQYFLFIFL